MTIGNEIINNLTTKLILEAGKASTEEDIRVGFENSFKTYVPQTGIEYDANYEKRVKSGRVDALFRHLVVEYKEPHLFESPGEYNKAANQALKYIKALASENLEDDSDYIAMFTDGFVIGFTRFTCDGDKVISTPRPINEESVHTLVEYMHALNFKALSANNILADFGPNSPVTRRAVNALWEAFANKKDRRSSMFFLEWQRLFGQVSGFGKNSGPEMQIKSEAQRFGIDIGTQYTEFVFILHSYYSLLIKLIALFILQSIKNNGFELSGTFADATLEDRLTIMQEMENGTAFKNLGISNFLEGDFFSWYLNEWNEDISNSIKEIVTNLCEYEPSTPALMPEAVRDLLKLLYEQLLPKTIRHDLGEFYTPDWLAQHTINSSGMKPSDKVLDPTCGSGTFLILTIKEKISKLKTILPPDKLVEHILTHVYGFDLNPLAVIASRTNYIMAIGDLLQYVDNIEIPVYLTDAIFSPQKEAGKYTYRLDTDMGTIDLNLPEQIVTDGNLGICLIEIENMVVQTSEGLISEDEAKCLLTEFLDALGIVAASNEVIHLYTKILDLERKNWNRIWCRIIKNHFASASLNDFDVIVGNPPWLRWSSLPETYRNTIKPFCVQYGLFSSDNFVGGIESDISTMVLYTAAQKWLRTGGRLAFLITRTVFKTESSEGFRKFRVPNDQTLQFRVIKVEDFTDLKPFEGATNKPALVVIEKGKKTKYPVKWTVWKRINRNPIGDSYDLKEVKRETDVVKLVAHPLKNEGDPWLTVLPSLLDQCLALVRKDESDYYLARKGICTDCNGIYYGNILSKRGKQQVTFENSPELGRNNKVTKVRANIEKSLIYPIARGREVSAFHWNFSGVYGIVPQSGMDGFPRLTMLRQYPKALNFFNNFNAILPTRASFRRYHLKRNAPIYSCWNVGPYTFSPYKVAWAEISGKFSACVISSFNSEYWDNPRVIIPDHKLYFVPLDNEQEAHYLCAFLNAPQVADFIHGYVENTQIGTHITEYLDIPKFNAKRKTHIQLSEISQNAHQGAIDSEEAVSRIEVIVKRVLKRKSTKS